MATPKTRVIEAIFNELFDANQGKLTREVVYFEDVQTAIRNLNRTEGKEVLSDRNPANFFKDFPRHRDSANRNFPQSVFGYGYTAEQVVGERSVFRFVPVTDGQTVPFPEDQVPGLDLTPRRIQVQSLGLSRAAKELGREDENWLIQVIVSSKVVETHFALSSGRRVLQVDFLQSGVKLRQSEIDALFLLTEESEDGAVHYAVATCEVKGSKEQATPSQLIRQPKAYLSLSNSKDIAVPVYIQALGDGSVRVIEYKEFHKDQAKDLEPTDLQAASASIIELLPHVKGLKRSTRSDRRKVT